MACGGLLLQTLLVCGTAVSGQGTWITKTMPPVGEGNQACAAVGSLFYHFDVRTGGTGKLWKYTPTTDSWASGTACARLARRCRKSVCVACVQGTSRPSELREFLP
jgi:hypothetical protein